MVQNKTFFSNVYETFTFCRLSFFIVSRLTKIEHISFLSESHNDSIKNIMTLMIALKYLIIFDII